MVVFIKVLIGLSYLTMIAFNVLANALPLGGQTTGAVSAKYPTLFTPSGFTFSIWGLIYLLVGLYVIKTLMTPESAFTKDLRLAGLVFAAASCLNIAWLFAWHTERIGLSTIVIALLLGTLLVNMVILKRETFLVRGAFSVYAAWVSVALIANVSIWLVSRGVPSFASVSLGLTIAVLLVGVFLAGVVAYTARDVVFVFVFVWAYLGIFLRHLNQVDLPARYPAMLVVLSLSLVALIGVALLTWILNSGKLLV